MLASTPARELEFDSAFCWPAVCSRDRRFDGRFFAGIVSTGIYCRPICPASFGRRNNVRWFRSAASAVAAGFRPCRRCRADSAPGTPGWSGSAAVVARALRLIAEDGLDSGGVEHLAERLGIGSRHLRRLFRQHLGASPLRIARQRRADAARTLIEASTDGNGPRIAEVAARAGFTSIRQFNESMRSVFGKSPTELRRMRADASKSEEESGIVIDLAYRAPFDWQALIDFLSPRATPGVETVDQDSYSRTIQIHGAAGAIKVWPQARRSCLSVRIVLPEYRHLLEVAQRVRRMFDLGANPLRIARHLKRDPRLAAIVEARPGIRIPGAWDAFELGVLAVLGQDLTFVGAPALAGRLAHRFGKSIESPLRGLSQLFPDPEVLAQADLRSIGVPKNQAVAIRSLAIGFRSENFGPGSHRVLEELLSQLRSIPGEDGIAGYIAMRGFGEPDALPIATRDTRGALGFRSGRGSLNEMPCEFEQLRPWRAYAAMHLATANQHRRVIVT
jgi:AraC family transcriptional regulator of adaptative response / DNA-3-methyladenine glycosylase II